MIITRPFPFSTSAHMIRFGNGAADDAAAKFKPNAAMIDLADAFISQAKNEVADYHTKEYNNQFIRLYSQLRLAQFPLCEKIFTLWSAILVKQIEERENQLTNLKSTPKPTGLKTWIPGYLKRWQQKLDISTQVLATRSFSINPKEVQSCLLPEDYQTYTKLMWNWAGNTNRLAHIAGTEIPYVSYGERDTLIIKAQEVQRFLSGLMVGLQQLKHDLGKQSNDLPASQTAERQGGGGIRVMM